MVDLFIVKNERYKGFLKDCPTGKMDAVDYLKLYKQYFPFGDPSPFAIRFDFQKFSSIKIL
jgi:hypothetical protein